MRTLIAIAASSLISAAAFAQDTEFQNPCHISPGTDFDFWVGDWVAFDYDTGVVQGIDIIEHTNAGCTIYQEWSQMTDRFRAPGQPHRYAGISFSSVLNDGQWQQVWIGNYGGTINMVGGLDDAGRMVLSSGEQSGQNADGDTVIFERTWYWAPEADGTVHSWGEIRTQNEDGSWSDAQISWNLRYVNRSTVSDLIEAPTE